MAKDIRIERRSGVDLIPYIADLARLRIQVFRDFPYLYDGDLGYEKKIPANVHRQTRQRDRAGVGRRASGWRLHRLADA